MSSALDACMAFVIEADRLKSVERANVLQDSSRAENAAEHSWHLSLCALVLAPDAPPGADIDRSIAMLLLHDLPEIDAGDMPVDQDHDADALRAAEQAGADRLFALLPAETAARMHRIRDEFEAGLTPSAVYAKRLDHLQPTLQVLQNPAPPPDHTRIARDVLTTGRAAYLKRDWPEAHDHAMTLLSKGATGGPLAQRMDLLSQADRLKTVIRATRLADGSRFENSAEHSWHLALMALVLPCPDPVDRALAIRMLVLHDLIEIDAGDTPIFATTRDEAEKIQSEAQAADRLFGMLPDTEGQSLRAVWDAFEAAETPTARWAKALDRFQPPNLNLANGGGSWVDYSVSEDQVRARVGPPIQRGDADLWNWLSPKIAAHFQS